MASIDLKTVTAVRGYHLYKYVWNKEIGNTFQCEKSEGIAHDCYAVALKLILEGEYKKMDFM